MYYTLNKDARETNNFNKIGINGTGNSFVTLKDHKKKLFKSTDCKINPAKNELGRIGKHRSQNINITLSEEIKVNEWNNTESVIKRFKNIPNNYLYKFSMFNIKNFYPSITKNSYGRP